MNTVFSLVVVLGALIFVHELGHFLWAKLFRVKVLKFSLGFGPKIFGRKIGETEYILSALPLGGYVKMFGEGEEAEDCTLSPAQELRSFACKPVWQRFCIVAGGPLFNLLFAALLFFLIVVLYGMPEPVDSTTIAGVRAGSPAATVGMKAGDEIVTIDSFEVKGWEEIAERIKESRGGEVSIQVRRGTEKLFFSLIPALEEDKNIFGEVIGKRYMIGISRSDEVVYRKVPLSEALRSSVVVTWNWITLTVMGFVKIIQKVIPASEIGGPILIAQMAGKQMEAGLLNFLHFMAIVSVNLGILNLLPIPILDGGHLVFLSMEGILRRPLSMRTMEIMQQVGLVLLGTFMVFVFYNDILRLFN